MGVFWVGLLAGVVSFGASQTASSAQMTDAGGTGGGVGRRWHGGPRTRSSSGTVSSSGEELELELELIQTHVAQNPMLRVEGGWANWSEEGTVALCLFFSFLLACLCAQYGIWSEGGDYIRGDARAGPGFQRIGGAERKTFTSGDKF